MRFTLPASLLGAFLIFGASLIAVVSSAEKEPAPGQTLSEISVIGVHDGIIDTYNFVQNHIPKLENKASTLRVTVGINVDAVGHTSGGDAPDVDLYNEEGTFIASKKDPGNIGGGSFKDIDVVQGNKQQPAYVLLTGNKDAVCIAYLSQVWPDGQPYGWMGGWGKECGVPWYYSGITLNGKTTDCVWLDKDQSVTDVTAFQVHIPEFNENGGPHRNDKPGTSYYCDNSPVLKFYRYETPDYIVLWGNDKPPVPATARRSVQPPHNRTSIAIFANHLTKSNHTAHSATKLCESDTARGPDLVSFAEGKFCDMETRKVFPLCHTVDGGAQDCFDTAAHDVRVVKEIARRNVAILAERKNYTKVRNWY